MDRKSRVELIRRTFPYGKWTTTDGTQVLFNRSYNPIWKKDSDGTLTEITEYWFVPNIESSEYYYNDWCAPHRDFHLAKTKDTQKRCLDVLKQFGVTHALHEISPAL